MEPSYTLKYYEEIFGGRTKAFWELVEVLEAQLGTYSRDLSELAPKRDAAALARLRHCHRPMVEDLGLGALKDLETQIQGALDQGAPADRLQGLADQFAAEARRLARLLNAERLPDDPGLPPPSPGG